MDTKTLVVGQEVYMFDQGNCIMKGKVVEITSSGVVIEELAIPWAMYPQSGQLLYFDNNGRERDDIGRRKDDDTYQKFSVPENQPYEIDYMTLEERDAWFEKTAKERKEKNSRDWHLKYGVSSKFWDCSNNSLK